MAGQSTQSMQQASMQKPQQRPTRRYELLDLPDLITLGQAATSEIRSDQHRPEEQLALLHEVFTELKWRFQPPKVIENGQTYKS